ncbi:MAG TPA: DUF4157 domain-containing protein, partial [Dehalococcoidia bacterium]
MPEHDANHDQTPKVAERRVAVAGGPVAAGPAPLDGCSLLQSSIGNASVGRLAAGGVPLEPELRQYMERAFGRDFGGVRLFLDSDLPAKRDARSLTVGQRIYVRPGAYLPRTEEGFRLLVHELAHVAQQQGATSVAAPTERGDAAEANAEDAVAALLRGQRPQLNLMPLTEARDEPVKAGAKKPAAKQAKAGEKKPGPEGVYPEVAVSSMSVTLGGTTFLVSGKLRHHAGNRGKQSMMVVLRRLVPNSYRPGLEDEAIKYLASKNIPLTSEMNETAQEGEVVDGLRVQPDGMQALVEWLQEKKYPLDITDHQLELIQFGVGTAELWALLHVPEVVLAVGDALPDWYPEELFDRQMTYHATLLKRYAAITDAVKATLGTDAQNPILSILKDIMAALKPGADVFELIFMDKYFVQNKKYAKTIDSVRKSSEMISFFDYIGSQPDVVKAASQEFAPHYEARTALLERFIVFLGREVEGGISDATLSDSVPRSNAPPNPALMSRYPMGAPPLFEAVLGTEYHFTMAVQFPDIYEAVGEAFGNISYLWERVKVPDELLAKWAAEAARRDASWRGDSDQPAKPQLPEAEVTRSTRQDLNKMNLAVEHLGDRGEEGGEVHRPTTGDVWRAGFARAEQYNEADAARAVDFLKEDLGAAGVAAATLVGANNIMRFIGTTLRLAFETLFRDPHTQPVIFNEPGVYLVRCRAMPVLNGNEKFIRAPSVAYLPVYARNPQELANRGAQLQMAGRDNASAEAAKLRAELEKDPDQPKKRERLESIERALGPIADQLEYSRQQLSKQHDDAVKALQSAIDAGDEAKVRQAREEEKALKDRLDEIDKIIDHRSRHGPLTNPLRHPERLLATFASDAGQSINLQLEAVEVTAEGDDVSYFVGDSTTKHSGGVSGNASDAPKGVDAKSPKAKAIMAALKDLLEGTTGYGRGNLAVWIDGDLVTMRVEASLGSLVTESAADLAMIAGIILALMAQQPALILLIIAVAGALKSAYRIAERVEKGTFDFDMDTLMDIVNIAGAVAGILRPLTYGVEFLRLGRAVAVIGLGVDMASVLTIPVSVVDQLSHIDPDAPESVRRAQAMEIIGMGMVQVGLVAGNHLLAEAARAPGAQDIVGARRAGAEETLGPANERVGTSEEVGVTGSAGAEEPTPTEEAPAGGGTGRQTREVGGLDRPLSATEGAVPAAGGVSERARLSGRAEGFSLSELRQFFFRSLRRIPLAHDDMVELEVDPMSFRQAYINSGGSPRDTMPLAFVDPKSGRIWVSMGADSILTVFHEAVHQYSISAYGEGARNRFVQRYGAFMEEGITEWITRRHLGPQAEQHAYDAHVDFIERLIKGRGVNPDSLEAAYLDGNMGALRTEIERGFGGDSDLTDQFLGSVRDIGIDRSNTEALNNAEYMLQTGREPATSEEPTQRIDTRSGDGETTRTGSEDDETTQVTRRPERETSRSAVGDSEAQGRGERARAEAETTQTRRPRRAASRDASTDRSTAEGKALAAFDRGKRHAAQGNHREAIIALERVRQSGRASEAMETDALLTIGESNLGLQRNNTAVFYFEAYLNRPDANVELGMRLLNRARRAAGLPESPLRGPATAEGAGAALPVDQVKQMLQQGSALFSRGEIGEAIAAFEQLRQSPGVPDEVRAACVYNIGLCNLKAKRFATALFYFEQYRGAAGADTLRAGAAMNQARRGLGLPELRAPESEPGRTGQDSPPRSSGPGDGDNWDEITQPEIPVGGVRQPRPASGERTLPTVERAPGGWLGRWRGDPGARVFVEENPTNLRVIDIYAGNQPKGSAGDMVADVILDAQRQGMPMRDRIRISNLQPEPSRAAYRAGGKAAEDPVFRGTIEALQRRLGRTATEVLYVHEADAVSIDIYFAARAEGAGGGGESGGVGGSAGSTPPRAARTPTAPEPAVEAAAPGAEPPGGEPPG